MSLITYITKCNSFYDKCHMNYNDIHNTKILVTHNVDEYNSPNMAAQGKPDNSRYHCLMYTQEVGYAMPLIGQSISVYQNNSLFKLQMAHNNFWPMLG